jgi:hypothetical protein
LARRRDVPALLQTTFYARAVGGHSPANLAEVLPEEQAYGTSTVRHRHPP